MHVNIGVWGATEQKTELRILRLIILTQGQMHIIPFLIAQSTYFSSGG